MAGAGNKHIVGTDNERGREIPPRSFSFAVAPADENLSDQRTRAWTERTATARGTCLSNWCGQARLLGAGLAGSAFRWCLDPLHDAHI